MLRGYAALAYQTGDHPRASQILATLRGNVRSPASHALYLHHRDLLKALLSKPERTQILERAAHLDPIDILDRELARPPRPTTPSKADDHTAPSFPSEKWPAGSPI